MKNRIIAEKERKGGFVSLISRFQVDKSKKGVKCKIMQVIVIIVVVII